MTVHAFVRAPFDQYVHDNSRFWNASGASVQLGANGLQLQVESLRALVLGGIAFDTPERGRRFAGERRKSRIPALSARTLRMPQAFPYRLSMMAYFQRPVAGLASGAAVTLHGISIGQVESVGLQYDKGCDNVWSRCISSSSRTGSPSSTCRPVPTLIR